MKVLLSVFVLFVLMMPIAAQEETETPTTSENGARTPTELCEAATPAREPVSREFDEPQAVLEDGVDYYAVMCTSAGAIYFDLFEDYTPVTVNNFVFLAQQGYYNNTIFHRVIEEFMAQGGDPTGSGRGGPGYQFVDEPIGFLVFDRPGLLAMANSGANTNGSQFFVTTVPTPWLNGNHTIFGEVLEGYDTVLDIELRDPSTGTGETNATTLDTVIIIRDPSQVSTTYVDDTEVATVDTFIDSLRALDEPDIFPADMQVLSGVALETEDVAAIAPDDLRADYDVFLNEYGHEYRITAGLDNAACNASYFIVEVVYSVDAFADEEAASDAVADDFLPEYYANVGYEAVVADDGRYSAYFAETAQCAEGELALTLDLQRGRYIANLSVLYPQSMVSQYSLDELISIALTELLPVFEANLADAYWSELR